MTTEDLRTCPPGNDDEPSRLFHENVALACHVARGYRRVARRVGLEFDDMLQDAHAGLWHACRRFDPSRGFKFSSYAHRCISGFILRGMNRFRFGAYREGHGFDHAKRLKSIVGPQGDDMLPLLAWTDPDAVTREVEGRERSERIEEALCQVKPREQFVLRRRMHGETLEALAPQVGVTPERVRQIEARGMAMLERAVRRVGVESA
jgi:RNA polymerase sigma factor (sigma-70 family)